MVALSGRAPLILLIMSLTAFGCSMELSGSAVKGPLANAQVTIYDFDPSAPDFTGATPLATGTTDASAQVNATIPPFIDTPFIVVVEAIPGTTDLSLEAGFEPAITVMRTAVTAEMLTSGAPIYATPLTTMAIQVAGINADTQNGGFNGDADGTTTLEEFASALPIAGQIVSTSLGFGLPSDTDLFTTPPLLTADTDTPEELAMTAAYRTAVEATTAILIQLGGAGLETDQVLNAVANDLADGAIDGMTAAGMVSEYSASQIATAVATDIGELIVPGATNTVGDTEAQLLEELADTGVTVEDTTPLEEGGSANVDPEPLEPIPDTDMDGTPDISDAFPEDPNEQQDSDNDGTGDNADAFDNDPTETTDTDLDGIGNNADTDDDGDGVPDTIDAFPLDGTETTDTDADGVGDVADNCPSDANPDQQDTDLDGLGDVCDGALGTTWDDTNWNESDWQ